MLTNPTMLTAFTSSYPLSSSPPCSVPESLPGVDDIIGLLSSLSSVGLWGMQETGGKKESTVGMYSLGSPPEGRWGLTASLCEDEVVFVHHSPCRVSGSCSLPPLLQV